MGRQRFAFILLILFILILPSANRAESPEKYLLVRVEHPDLQTLQKIRGLGIPLDHAAGRLGKFLEFAVSGHEARRLGSGGIAYQTIISDLSQFYARRLQSAAFDESALRRNLSVSDFGFGSMGGYYTFDEVVGQLDSLLLLFPNIITERESLGTSVEGRPIWMVKISDNPTLDEDEPEVLYTALHHAREPESMMAVLYFMWYLCENYGTDPEATHLVDDRELYFVPVVNPDGYVYNQTISSSGGGMWRKNRSFNSDGSRGVDLNRNYGFEWGHDDEGSSPDPVTSTYRGTAPFSEPETQAMRDFCVSRNFKLALNYHAYSNLLIYPWGYEYDFETPDSSLYREYALSMTQFNDYVYGTGNQTVNYLTNGDSDDWLYGDQTSKNKVLAMTPEVGGPEDGFWPPRERILPLAEENLYPNLYLAQVAGPFFEVKDFRIAGEYVNPGDDSEFTLLLKNIGLADATEEVTAHLSSDDPYLSFPGDSLVIAFGKVASQDSATGAITIAISPETPSGHEASFKTQVFEGQTFIVAQDFSFFVGTPQIAFRDDAEEGMHNWQAPGKWDTVSVAYEGRFAFHDSPDGNYPSNVTNIMTMQKGIDLSEGKAAFLEFRTKWAIEGSWDFGQVEISTDGAVSWTSLKGKYTRLASGNGRQTTGYGYDGFQPDWVKESIDLTDYLGEKDVRVRFKLLSDAYLERDGWYLDDIRVLIYHDSSAAAFALAPDSLFIDTQKDRPWKSFFAIQNLTATDLTYLVRKPAPGDSVLAPGDTVVTDPPTDFFGFTLPSGAQGGPDLASVQASETGTPAMLSLEFTFYSEVDSPFVGIVSLDVDANFATGHYPAAFGFALPTQNVGSEYELVILNGYMGIDGFRIVAAGDTSLTPVPSGTGSIQVSGNKVTLAFPEEAINSPQNINFSALFFDPSQDGNPTLPDWAPDFGHGRIFAEEAIPWLGFTPTQNTIAPGKIDTVRLLTVADLEAGNHAAELLVALNDSNGVQTSLPIFLKVSPTLPAKIEPNVLTEHTVHDTLRSGETSIVSFTVENVGDGDLVTAAVLARDWARVEGFIPGMRLQTTAPAATSEIRIRFNAGNLATGRLYQTYLLLATNDPDATVLQVPVSLFVDTPVAVNTPRPTLPEEYVLEANFPNPFNPTTEIRYALPIGGAVTLEIYNVLGQKIRTLVDEFQPAGFHHQTWDGRDDERRLLPSGIYLYRLKTERFTQTRRMVLLR